jgi:hypothetical protein
MPYSYNAYTGNGSTTQFTIGFPYIRQEHVKVYVAYVDTAYTYVNNTTVQLATAPGAGVRVEVRRITPVASVLVDFADGSTLVAADLDTSNLQHLYLEQELDDYSKQTISIDPATGLLTAANQRITNVADPVNAQDVATKAYTDAQIDSVLINDVIAGTGLTISDNTPTAGQITVGITNSGVGVTQIADGAVTSAKIADATIITGDLADGAVTSAKIADGTIVAGDLASDSVTTAKILNANVTTAKIADLNVTTGKIADLGVTTGKIADAAVTAAKIAGGSIDSTKLDGATVVTNSEHSGSTPNDTSFFTTSASDARYFRQDSSETISSGQTWSASDSYIATTAAIDARVIDLVDDVGGFVPIANENSFPVANPDINNPDGTGTIVSIAVMSTSRTPSSGTVTIANGSGSNTVTITGCGSTVLAAGFGVLVETTSTLHTYTFHRLTPKATEVTTVASISADVTTVAGNNANVTAVAGNAANIATVGGSIANVNAVGGSIANVNSVASNLASVNSFANTYRIAASDPATSLDVGDLVFNTTASELRVYNGSVWQGGVTATGNLVSRAGDTMTGALVHPLGAAATPSITFTGDLDSGVFSPGANQVAVATNGTEKLIVLSNGDVGIGTSSPSTVLHLNTLAGTNTLQTFSLADSAKAFIGLSAVTNSPILGATVNDLCFRSENANIRFGAASSTRSDLTITTAGLVGIGTIPGVTLDVNGQIRANNDFLYADATATRGRVYGDSTGLVVRADTGLALRFHADAGEKARIDTSGRLLVGTSTSIGTFSSGLQVVGTANDSTGLFARYSNNDSGSFLHLAKSRSGTAGTNTVVQNGDELGTVNFSGADGTNYLSGARIAAFVDGTPGANDLPSRLTFATTADAASSPTERMRIDSSGRVGISSTTLIERLHVNGGVRLDVDNQGLYFNSSTTSINGNGTSSFITFNTSNAEKARLDSSGRLLVGTSTAQQVTGGDSPFIQVQGTDASSSSLSVIRHAANSAGSWISLGKSRGSAAGAATVVLSGDTLGTIAFVGADGTDLNTIGAQIRAEVDGTPGSNDLPSRLTFSTTADAASSPTERFRISSDGSFSSVIPGGSTLYPRFGCRAWVNFNGTGTVAIRASGNVSSITDNGVGDYTVNFTTAMVDANYAAVGMNSSTGSPNRAVAQALDTTPVAGSVRIKSFSTSSNVLADEVNILVAVFR